jgi:sigma54-dependent transcription regulator
VEAARVLAENALKAAPDRAAQISWAFRKVLARAPGERDLATLLSAWEKQHQRFAADPKAAIEFISVGTAPRDAKLPAPDHAALAAVCLAIFNLDESLTRQ